MIFWNLIILVRHEMNRPWLKVFGVKLAVGKVGLVYEQNK